MPSTTLKTIPLTQWYCQECAIESGLESGLIKEDHICVLCHEDKMCTHPMKIEKSYNSRTRIGQAITTERTERNPNERVCPDCGETISHLNYGASGCYARGTYYFTDGGCHEMDECDENGADFSYSCPECGHEDPIEEFHIADDDDDRGGDAEETPPADCATKGGDTV
jgi:predicted RNA-binding Zn-ribbon protein involved in translation (DUF1610 family)